MEAYPILYYASAMLAVAFGAATFDRYRNSFGWHFFLFTAFGAAWFTFYYLFFSGIGDPAVLLFLSRLNFGIGVGATWSFWFFVRSFGDAEVWKPNPQNLLPLGFFAVVIAWYCSTGSIVEGLAYSEADRVFREIPGPFLPVHAAFHLIAVIGAVWATFRKKGVLPPLEAARFRRVVGAVLALVSAVIVLQLVLPAFGIWVLEKEIVVLFLAFAWYSHFVLREYFFNERVGWARIAFTAAAFAGAVGVAEAVRKISESTAGSVTDGNWGRIADGTWAGVAVGTMAFALVYGTLGKRLFGDSRNAETRELLTEAGRSMAKATGAEELSILLENAGKEMFWSERCSVVRAEDRPDSEILRFFRSDPRETFYLSEGLFFLEKQGAIDPDKARADHPETQLAFPLRPNGVGVEGFLSLGRKKLAGRYSRSEFGMLKEFAFHVEMHLRHIETYAKLRDAYAQLRDLTENLDRKVDEKTMEYNDLINRQKEFISVVSHEMKAPITNAVFQADSVLDEIDAWSPPETVRGEIEGMAGQLARAGDLLNKLFSAQHYDTRSVSLFKEEFQFARFLRDEISVHAKLRPEIRFVETVSASVGYVSADRIQMQQVVSNLLQNAAKHSGNANPTVSVRADCDDGILTVGIEDDGNGFAGVDVAKVFDRYSTGIWGSVGLGIGLYLCRKIVEMHGGSIRAGTSEAYGGAKFEFDIPIR